MAIKLEKSEEQILDKMVEAGLFSSKDEAARAAIIKYAFDLGFFSPDTLWRQLTQQKKRGVSPEQLKKDLSLIEDET